RTDGARPRAGVRQVAFARRRPARRAGVPRRVLARVARAVAGIRAARIAVVGAAGARRALRIHRAVRGRPGAVLRRVALAGRWPADDAARLEHVVGTGAARPGAGLVHVARAGRRPADRPAVARRMLAVVARAVARVGRARVAVVRACRARRVLRIGRARRTGAGTVLRRVALAARRTAGGRRRLEGVVRARATRSRAELVEVAVARRGAADGPGVARRVLAGIARTVTGVGGADVAVIRAEGATRLLGVGRARLARQAAAALGDVALPDRGPAGEHVRERDVGRAGAAHAGAHV